MADTALADVFASLGLSTADAERARRALEDAGLTNPRKSRIADAKLDAVRTALDARFARLCPACRGRTDPQGRVVLSVPASACSRCGGSRNDRALAELVDACRAVGIGRLVVVGGSPDVRRELATVGDALELRLVDGVARRTKAEALRDLAWADLVVVGGSSELAHKVSNLYTRERGGTPVIVAPRRGVEAIAGAVVEHARRR